MRTQVAIIGGGPSGLLLAQLLHTRNIHTVVLERKDRDYVLGRIRAGVLERGLVDLMDEAGVCDRLRKEGFEHNGTTIAYGNQQFRIPFSQYIDKPVTIYGQTEVTRDLYDAREAVNGTTVFNVDNVVIHEATTKHPYINYTLAGEGKRLDCDFVAGCDGFHGVSRQSIPAELRKEYEKVYPFAWLGILSETPPVNDELVYSNSDRGFALCSMRNENLSRYYIQCSLSDNVEIWSDSRFWKELKRRLPEDVADILVTGPSIEKSIAPLRSFVCETMRWGQLFLCGDAAHIVPPTGAKGLNTAASDVHYLYHGLVQFYENNTTDGIDNYTESALARVWKVERFSAWMTAMLHRFSDQTPFDVKIQQSELAFLRENESAQASLAQNYVGLPY